MRVLSYNIRLGLESSLGAVGELIASARADLVGLQEIGRGWVMGEPGDQLARLGELTGLDHRVLGAALTIDPSEDLWTEDATGLPEHSLRALTTPGPQVRWPSQGGAHFGVGLLSRWPLSDVRLIRLPRLKDEQRVLLMVRVAASEGPLLAAVTHLSIHEDDRLAQTEVLASLLRKEEGPLLLMGDLNDSPHSACLERLRGAGLSDAFPCSDIHGSGSTYPSQRPLLRIDYLLVGGGIEARSCLTLPCQASDHLPLLTELCSGSRSSP